MTQLGEPIPSEVSSIRQDLDKILSQRKFNLVDANSVITGRDFLQKIWDMLVSVPLAVAIVHEDMPAKTQCNIFYEIGIAQALGKETIVIKTQKAEVPSDFVRTEYIEYDGHFEEKIDKYLNGLFERADYYELMAEQLQENPLLAIDYLRRAFLVSGQEQCSEQAKKILSTLSLEGRTGNSVEILLAKF